MIDKNFFHSVEPAFSPDFTSSISEDFKPAEKRMLIEQLKSPTYIGRLLISCRITGYFINPIDHSQRTILEYEKLDIESRFRSLNSDDQAAALNHLQKYEDAHGLR